MEWRNHSVESTPLLPFLYIMESPHRPLAFGSSRKREPAWVQERCPDSKMHQRPERQSGDPTAGGLVAFE